MTPCPSPKNKIHNLLDSVLSNRFAGDSDAPLSRRLLGERRYVARILKCAQSSVEPSKDSEHVSRKPRLSPSSPQTYVLPDGSGA